MVTRLTAQIRRILAGRGEQFRVLNRCQFLILCLEVRVAICDGIEFRSQQCWLWAKACSTIRLSKKNALSEDNIRLSNSMPEKHNHLSNRRKRKPRGRTRRESQRNQQIAMVTKVKEGEFQKVETSQRFSTWKPQGDQL